MARVTAKPFKATTYGFVISVEKPRVIEADYWALAKADSGWRMELAFASTPADWTAWATKTLGLPENAEAIAYEDGPSGTRRLAFFKETRLLAGLFLAKEPVPVARDFLVSQLSAPMAGMRERFQILAGRPDAGKVDKGPIVCSCMSVGVHQILAAIRQGCGSVEAIGRETKAGTNCGSCRAEIKEIMHGSLAAAAE
jgi:assimilatory nitrate reductase catalytic subunit